jgi:chromosome segregation protein
MVQFSKLRLTGFKSFPDATEIDIMQGLNGIVGPNGCGKSNLVEAMRWLMGETSPKSLRGGEMDDVIFAGTGKRPSRNHAEVVLTLNNADRTAPEPYTNLDTIEVSRRIDRGMGSDYRINGKAVRAADVQLLFADSSTGAHSPAIVSQGRVTALIQAKPVDRRRVLEDAAAISGLHNRRKEAETKLRAAEKNLTRVDDLLGQKSGVYEQLVKQAKQAERYKVLADTIRRLEALSLVMEYTRVTQEIEAAQASMVVANEAQNQAKQALYDVSKQRDGLQSRWDAVDRAINEQRQKMQNVQRDKDIAQAELQRFETQRADLNAQRDALTQDQAYEVSATDEAAAKIAELQAEQQAIEQSIAGFEGDLSSAQKARDEAKASYDTAAAALNEARAAAAGLNAQRQMLHQQIQRAQSEVQNIAADTTRTDAVLAEITRELQALDVVPMQQRLAQAESGVQSTIDQTAAFEKQSETLGTEARGAFDELQKAQSALNRIDTEIKALSSLAEAPQNSQNFKAALDQVTVTNGYEQALSVALGRELRAGLDTNAPMYWVERADMIVADLPQGAKALYTLVKAPDALKTALSMIGVVEDQAAGERLINELKVGQMLVSKNGFGWRWDGYTVTPAAQATAQERETKQLLEQRNRLVELRGSREDAASAVATAQARCDELQVKQNELREQTAQARNAMAQLQREAGQARQELAGAERRAADFTARQTALTEKQADLAERTNRANESLKTTQDALNALQPEQESRDKVEALQTTANASEETYREVESKFLGLATQQAQSQNRLNNIARELNEWQQRETASQSRNVSITERLEKVNTAIANLKSPDNVAEQMKQADATLQAMEGEMFTLESQRQEVIQSRNGFDAQNNQAQESLMAAREALVRAETQFSLGQTTLEQVIERCEQNMNCKPDEISGQFEFSEHDLSQPSAVIRAKQDRARGERDRIGAVNLRAEEEAETLGAEIAALSTEKEDIVQAIEKLRHGIATLNRDARKKMLAAFEEVNTRFKEVFTRLFNGGEAYLQLIDAEDPLEAGLEIFAQPPGKRLQTLTLLSGGEQSLTAIALIFAMFLTQPSPICVLDEIDAALDDANVERICSLLQDFAKTHPTRFLVITHNPITMASLHRLYGVTMVEKGVSKLVSVDLERHREQHAQGAMAVAAE